MAHTERTTSEVEKAVFRYLNLLRSEDMVGAIAVSTLQKKWVHLSAQECIDLIGWWNQNYNKEGDYDMITV